jgi:hypothetical protein
MYEKFCNYVSRRVEYGHVRTLVIASILFKHSHTNRLYMYVLCKDSAIVLIALACASAASSVHLAAPSA